MNEFSRYPFTFAVILINAAVYIAETQAGGSENTQVALKYGAQYPPRLKKGEYWRLFTAMFVHFGMMHILCNMYSLYNLGPSLERMLGSVRFGILYLVTGLAGNLLTAYIDERKGKNRISAGTSGCIFGLMGAWLVIALLPGMGRYISRRGILLTLAVNLYYGYRVRGINLAAHAGGLAAGIVMTLLLLRF